MINRRLKKYTVRIIAAIDKVGAAVRRTENGRYSAMSSGSESDIFFGGAIQKLPRFGAGVLLISSFLFTYGGRFGKVIRSNKE